MRRFHKRKLLPAVVFTTAAILATLVPARLSAQARPVATKKAEISAFGMYSRVSPDWGPPGQAGITFGADYMRATHWFLIPSHEFRATFAPGDTVGERTIGGGLRVDHPLGRFRPYADFLVSSGVITFTHPHLDIRHKLYKSDDSIVYTYGGGLEYDLTHTWAAKVDYQGEHWQLGINQSLTPGILSFGVTYRIPFRSYSR